MPYIISNIWISRGPHFCLSSPSPTFFSLICNILSRSPSIVLCHLSHFFPPGFYFSSPTYPSFISYFLHFYALMSYVLFLIFYTSVSHFLFLFIFSHVCISHFPESCLLAPTFSRYLPHYILSFTFLLLISVFLFLISRISTYYLPHFYLLSSTSRHLVSFILPNLPHIYFVFSTYLPHFCLSAHTFLYLISHISTSHLPDFHFSILIFLSLFSHTAISSPSLISHLLTCFACLATLSPPQFLFPHCLHY